MATKHRILYFIAYPQRMAGANRMLFNLISNLPQDIEPMVVSVDEGGATAEFRNAGIPTHVLYPGDDLNLFGKNMLRWSVAKQMSVGVRRLLPYTMRLTRFIRDNNIDLVHVNDPRGAILAGPATRLAARPMVAHHHGEFPFAGLPKKTFEVFPSRIISVCSSIQPSLSPRARSKSKVVYNGVTDVSHDRSVIPWLQELRNKGTLVVCSLATVVPFKGAHHLLDAAAILNERGWKGKVVFVWVGDLPKDYEFYQKWLVARRDERGIDNFLFTGWQSNPLPFYNVADATVLPSVQSEKLQCDDRVIEVNGNEGFPVTHLEAMWFGLPIVGTRIAGVSEQIESEVTGFVVPPSDPRALADAIGKLLSDKNLREKMGAAGRKRVESQFSLDTYVRGVVGVYQSIFA